MNTYLATELLTVLSTKQTIQFISNHHHSKYKQVFIQTKHFCVLTVKTIFHRDINNQQAGVLSWDEYFMAFAFLAAKRSKDPNTKVGACIVNQDNRIISTGYNGTPNGWCDDEFPWNRKTGTDNKNLYGKKSGRFT
jgi:deoxycytidylate deaminase